MPNWSAIEASFLRQPHAQQLGELAASLARLNSWSQKSTIRELLPSRQKITYNVLINTT